MTYHIESPTNAYSPEPGDDAETEFPYYTETEAVGAIGRFAKQLADLQQTFNDASATYAANVTDNPQLQGPHADWHREELDAQYLPALEDAEQRARIGAEIVHENVRAIYMQTQQAQYDFAPSDYQMIDARRATIKEDAANLSYARLASAVQYSILNDDKTAMYLYARYVPERLNYGADNGTWEDTASRQEKSQLQRMLRAIDRKLKNDKLVKINADAAKVMRDAGELERTASRRRMQAQRFAWQSDNDVPWTEPVK